MALEARNPLGDLECMTLDLDVRGDMACGPDANSPLARFRPRHGGQKEGICAWNYKSSRILSIGVSMMKAGAVADGGFDGIQLRSDWDLETPLQAIYLYACRYRLIYINHGSVTRFDKMQGY